MNLILVMYNLDIGYARFLKQISVQRVPSKGEHLKVENVSFVVVEVEQDMDAYIKRDYESGSSCEYVRAVINENCHDINDHELIEEIKESLTMAHWQKCKY